MINPLVKSRKTMLANTLASRYMARIQRTVRHVCLKVSFQVIFSLERLQLSVGHAAWMNTNPAFPN